MVVTNLDEDNVLIESSPFYHNYVFLLLADVYTWTVQYGVIISPSAKDKFPKMLNYATDVAWPDSHSCESGCFRKSNLANKKPDVFAPGFTSFGMVT